MSKTLKKNEKSEANYYPRLIVNRQRLIGIIVLATLAVVLSGFALAEGLFNSIPWATFGVPLCCALSAFILYPPTEEWEYKPWQAKPRRYEQHFID